jgi:hypothetical protein
VPRPKALQLTHGPAGLEARGTAGRNACATILRFSTCLSAPVCP